MNDKDIGIINVPDTFIPTDLQTAASSMALGQRSTKIRPIMTNKKMVYGCTHGLQTPNEAFFSSKSGTFGLGQTNWADKFWGIWGIFGQTISTHFGSA